MNMLWNPVWPFKSNESVFVYECVYLDGRYKAPNGKFINIVNSEDLQLEHWIERKMPKQQTTKALDLEFIRNIYIWKMRSTTGNSNFPAHLNNLKFAEALRLFRDASSENEIIESIKYIVSFSGIKIRIASAFMYWLRPDEFQIIDRRSTEALNLSFTEEDYSIENYLRYCKYCKSISTQQNLNLRQMDRALFTYQKLMGKGVIL